jgi:MFS family permease
MPPPLTLADAPLHAGSSRRVATLAILLSLVVAAFEGTVVTSAMPTIVGALGGLGIYAWVFSAFLLASTVGVLTCGKLADAHGRRPVFVAGMGLFLLGSALCGAATSIHQLIAFRVVQGLGAGAIQPIAMTISADLYTLRERARIQALFTSAWGAAHILGPILGGWIVIHASWRWVFLVNVPVGFLAVAMLLVSYRDPPRQRRGRGGAVGALLAGVVAALALVALERGEGRGLAARLIPAALAAVAAAALVWQQRRAGDPILPLSLLPDRVVRAGVLAGVFAGGLLYTCAAYVPLWMAQRLHADALLAGAALVPLLAGWALGSSFGVHVLLRWGMRASVGGGFAIASLGAAALAWAAFGGLPAPFVFAALALLGLGLGPAASTSLVAPQSHVSWQHRGMITSLIYASRMLGGSLAVTALGGAGSPAWRFAGLAAMALLALTVALAITPGRLEPIEARPEPPPPLPA